MKPSRRVRQGIKLPHLFGTDQNRSPYRQLSFTESWHQNLWLLTYSLFQFFLFRQSFIFVQGVIACVKTPFHHFSSKNKPSIISIRVTVQHHLATKYMKEVVLSVHKILCSTMLLSVGTNFQTWCKHKVTCKRILKPLSKYNNS